MDVSYMQESDYAHPKLGDTPNAEGMLRVSTNPAHDIHWEEWGNPSGEPLVIVHGGPGGGISRSHARIADPSRYRIILFDQRGCGKSQPHVATDLHGAMADNITQSSIDDIIKLRKELGITGKMHLYGGSWGSTLGIAFAEQHPNLVENLILRGIFLCDHDDLSFFYQGNAATYAQNPNDTSLRGAYRAYTGPEGEGTFTVPVHLRDPEMAEAYEEAWKRYVEVIPENERGNMIAAYYERLNNPKYSPQERLEAALAWSDWEGVTSFLKHNVANRKTAKDDKFQDPAFAIAFATIENEYFFRSLNGQDAVLSDLLKPEKLAALKTMRVDVVHGRYDQVCVPSSAKKFAAALKAAGGHLNMEFTENAGHALLEKTTCQALTEIVDSLLPIKSFWNNIPPKSTDGQTR